MRHPLLTLCALVFAAGHGWADGPETWLLPLSGKGPADAVAWDFQVTGGRRAGEQAKLPVPSQWEQHGFGDYDYGSVPSRDKHKEDGRYQRRFTVPADWQGRRVRIVFDGVMTDTTVTLNGHSAGSTHQGGFYRFHYDITDLLHFDAENQLEVLVSKDSANASIEEAERTADFWVFGGIYRPVWLEARPAQSIEWSAVDARADGTLRVKVALAGSGPADRVMARVLAPDGTAMGVPLETAALKSGNAELTGRVTGVRPWSAEEPTLYQLELSLMDGSTVRHRVVERIGFRTMDVRPGEGVFVNGRRITVKGVNRHCFRPASGRALDPQDSIDDVRLIKEMNMNAVRCSHYSPDQAFLDACDELGLYVIDELCTWQRPTLDTPSARRLVGELIRRDVNHPSILWWANGNEGGWNTAVDGDYAHWDPQQRPVLHPWEQFSGFQTKHYPTWQRLQQDLAGPHLVMPTEFLHGLYDGGHGAGLEDYWNAITSRPNGVGGFLWSFADEGIARTDRNGQIDNWGTNAPDGIVGPHHEREASFLTIKDIFSPVQIALRELPPEFSGRITVANKYDVRNLDTCDFTWWLERFWQSVPAPQKLAAPTVPPGGEGTLQIELPADWWTAEVLCLRAADREGRELWTWRWAVNDAAATAREALAQRPPSPAPPPLRTTGLTQLSVSAGDTGFEFDGGLLTGVRTPSGLLRLTNGPRLVGAGAPTDNPVVSVPVAKITASGCQEPNKPANAGDDSLDTRWSGEGKDTWLLLELAAPATVDAIAIAWQHAADRSTAYALELSEDRHTWTEVLREKSRRDREKWDTREFPARRARYARLRCFGNDINDWNSILELQLGTRRPAADSAPFTITQRRLDSGAQRLEATSPGPFEDYAWTLHPDGLLDLEYRYRIDQPTVYHGITFDLPEEDILAWSWVGQGPERVWANRLRGAGFGLFDRKFAKLRPGVDYDYPQCPGFYAGVHQAALRTKSGTLHMACHQDGTFVRVGTNDEGNPVRTNWPAGNFSILHAIPAIGNKFQRPEVLGPQSEPHPAPGVVTGKVSFWFSK